DPDVLGVAEGEADRVPMPRRGGEPVPRVLGDADGRARRNREGARRRQTGRLGPVRGGPRRGAGAGLAGRGAGRARGRPRVPPGGRRLHRGADPHLDRLQAGKRSRRRPAPAAPGGVLALLRRLRRLAVLELDVPAIESLEATRGVELRSLEAADWDAVADIYWDGIGNGLATFETAIPSWEEWSAAHPPKLRLVAEAGFAVAGWIAAAPVSSRRAYCGVVEHSVYVAADWRRKGIGRLLLEGLV